MIYKEIQPAITLLPYVKCFWWFENPAEKVLNLTILPDGCFDIIVVFKNNIQTEISLTGLWTQQVEVPIEPNTQIFGIRFKLLAADYILKQKLAAICDTEQKLPLNFWNIDKMSFTRLEQTAEKFNDIILDVIGDLATVESRILNLSNLLYETNGELTVQQYSLEVFWTSRQINRYFRDRFGLSLKSYANILRCFASFQQLRNGNLYPEQNYFDQSHFIKALKKYTGNSPTELFQNKNDRFLQLAVLTKK
ncbi:transcriptional regulator, AraC family [Pedobacter westerhofensis]|uniref:Transcriptional regulator, AraC family n=1 Tax=Pedobacter westerhofensis TaxID=425512 RepID=A0A521B5V4_9SPHI|nr:AraC family transcriptional regulator [Pedobacter westerhofensis]SMO42401.1 transcriptional regulator, AraC family [Pedobacter westerhofensis]